MLILETGEGVAQANAYVDPLFITQYLESRNRSTEGGWTSADNATKEAAAIAATDYIEIRWGHAFKRITVSFFY